MFFLKITILSFILSSWIFLDGHAAAASRASNTDDMSTPSTARRLTITQRQNLETALRAETTSARRANVLKTELITLGLIKDTASKANIQRALMNKTPLETILESLGVCIEQNASSVPSQQPDSVERNLFAALRKPIPAEPDIIFPGFPTPDHFRSVLSEKERVSSFLNSEPKSGVEEPVVVLLLRSIDSLQKASALGLAEFSGELSRINRDYGSCWAPWVLEIGNIALSSSASYSSSRQWVNGRLVSSETSHAQRSKNLYSLSLRHLCFPQKSLTFNFTI